MLCISKACAFPAVKDALCAIHLRDREERNRPFGIMVVNPPKPPIPLIPPAPQPAPLPPVPEIKTEPELDEPVEEKIRHCSAVGCQRELRSNNTSGRCTRHFYVQKSKRVEKTPPIDIPVRRREKPVSTVVHYGDVDYSLVLADLETRVALLNSCIAVIRSLAGDAKK
jgi:hypothetical protein